MTKYSQSVMLLYLHNNLLFEEGTVEGEGFIFTSFSTYMNSILLGELICQNKTFFFLIAKMHFPYFHSRMQFVV